MSSATGLLLTERGLQQMPDKSLGVRRGIIRPAGQAPQLAAQDEDLGRQHHRHGHDAIERGVVEKTLLHSRRRHGAWSCKLRST
jgi:hypothetical protein